MQSPTRSRAHLLPYLVLFFGVLAMGMSAIFTAWANAPGPVSGFYRMAIAAVALAIPFAIEARHHAPLSRFHIGLAIFGGILYAADLALWNTALLITNAANATLLGNTQPLWVGIGATLIFKEKLRPLFWSGLILATLGAAIVVGRDFLVHPALGWGDAMSLGAGFFYGAFFLVAERVRTQLSSLIAWWISAATSAVALFAISVLFQESILGYPLGTYVNFFALALITQVGGLLSINYALGHLRASLVSPTLLGQPVLTAIFAVPLLGQSLDAVQIIGGVVVIAGILLVHRTHTPTPEPTPG